MTVPATPDPVVLRAPRLLDGTGTPAVPDAALLVEGGRIAYAGPVAGLPRAGARSRRSTSPGRRCCPGWSTPKSTWWPAGGPTWPPTSPGARPSGPGRGGQRPPQPRGQGVTLVRDLGAQGPRRCWSGRAVEAGTVAGTRVVASGPAVTMTGGTSPTWAGSPTGSRPCGRPSGPTWPWGPAASRWWPPAGC
jgi:hypothetical protein